jgi:hypothetical protein
MCGFFTTDELDDLLFEASEVARFLLEVEGTTLDIDEEIDIEDRITHVMRGVGEAAKTILKTRGEETLQNTPEIAPRRSKKRKNENRPDINANHNPPEKSIIFSEKQTDAIPLSIDTECKENKNSF